MPTRYLYHEIEKMFGNGINEKNQKMDGKML